MTADLAKASRIRGLDGIRALAVIAVFLNHRSPLRATQVGHIGVLIFFALSGYLVIGILHRERRAIEAGARSFGAALAEFLKRRTLRIFPVYYATLAALAVLALIGHPAPGWRWDALPWHLGYLSNVYAGRILGDWQGSLSHLWSLSIEEQFYLVAAGVLLLIPSAWSLATCLIAAGAGLLVHALLVAGGANPVAIYTDSWSNFTWLALGGALRIAFDGRAWTSAALWAWPLGVLVAAAALVPQSAPQAVQLVSIPLGAAAAGLFVLAISKAQDGRLVAILEHPEIVRLGAISYGFYLFHNLFYLYVPLKGPAGVLVGMALNFAASYALAYASWRLFERPVQRLGSQIAFRKLMRLIPA